jgi:hypothetical protein
MTTAGFELATPASEMPQIQALDHEAIGIGGVARKFLQNAVICTPVCAVSCLCTLYSLLLPGDSFEDGQKLPFLNTLTA